jgi:hypothetical protein
VLTYGQSINATYGPTKSSITLSSSPQSILNASPGFGMGGYTLPMTFSITIPKTVSIQSKSGTGSKYNVGDFIGTPVGTYTSTITYMTGVGI